MGGGDGSAINSCCSPPRIADRYALRMVQLVTKVDDATAAAIDALVVAGVFESRSAVVRSGLETLLDREARAAVGAEILRGYDAVPETEAELAQAEAMSRAMIEEEPW